MHNPLRGLLHGAAAAAALVGAVVLAVRALELRHLIAGLVFGLSLSAMFAVSSLYHTVGWQERRKVFMQRLDHSMIFLVVAATFTPFGVVVLDGWLRAVLLTLVWAGAIVGIALKFTLPRVKTGLSVGDPALDGLALTCGHAPDLAEGRTGRGPARVRRRPLLHGRNRDLRDQEAPAISRRCFRTTSCSMCWWWRGAPCISWRCSGSSCLMTPERGPDPD